MTIKLGSTDINKLYLGSTEIKKAYLGSTLIHDTTGGGSSFPAIEQTTSATGSFDGSGDKSVTLPSGRTVGNYDLIVAGAADNDVAFGVPTGFTATTINQTGSSGVLELRIFHRLITAGNVGDTTVTVSAEGNDRCAILAAEVSGMSGVGATATANDTSGSSTGHTGQSVTTTAANSLVLEAMVFRTNNGGTPPSPGGEVDSGSGNCYLQWGTQEVATAGATSGLTFTTVDNENGFPSQAIELLA